MLSPTDGLLWGILLRRAFILTKRVHGGLHLSFRAFIAKRQLEKEWFRCGIQTIKIFILESWLLWDLLKSSKWVPGTGDVQLE